VGSAIWAAYGDALGFITELADEKGVRRRLQGDAAVHTTVPWKRRVGGQFGVTVELPAGTYSDDTQLRLATSRAIRDDGFFDVEAFSKIEITVWPAYALGGGRGTRAAASALAKPRAHWANNHFTVRDIRYVHAGGNGAAMRVQPHVWSAKQASDPSSFLSDVIRDTICTHGHFRGIVGAAFHALCLSYQLERGSLGPAEWKKALNLLRRLPNMLRDDDEIRQNWIRPWEEQSKTSIDDACNVVIDECLADLTELRRLVKGGRDVYVEAVDALGGRESASRGSGTKTALLASFLAHVSHDDAHEALLVAANAIGSDTDTIATMAGALIGAAGADRPRAMIMDEPYIEAEAVRLSTVAEGGTASSFSYPDLLRWTPPRTQLDVVGKVNGALAVAGLGHVIHQDERVYRGPRAADEVWQWLQLELGETILVKRRAEPRPLPESARPMTSAHRPTLQVAPEQTELFQEPREDGMRADAVRQLYETSAGPPMTLHEATKLAWSAQLDPEIVGSILLELAKREDGVELAIGFAAIVSKAVKTQSDRRG
jgi:ADP-ribosylglycohydrolase